MASLKYEILLLDHNTRFVLWQIKMQTVLAQIDLEDTLLGINKMPSTLKMKRRSDVMKEKTAAALWKRLEQICMSKTLTSKLHMKQRLYAHRLDEGADTILDSCESLTVDEVYDSLTSYDKMKHLVVKPDSQGKGLIVRGRQDRNVDDDRGKTQERNLRSKYKGRSKSSNREDYSDSELLVAFVNNSKVSDEWILDSGCTFHMSPNRDWFTTYETVSEGVDLVGNNASCKIAGVGTMKVKMFDGVARTFSDVRHVPELKRNLISLSTLNSKEYRYTAENGVLKISKGFLVVMKGQRKTAKLYVLQGSTITGDAAIAFLLVRYDITKLWHMHLGHMSENGMAELSKRRLLDGQGICKLNFCKHYVLGSKREFDSLEKSITRREHWSIFILICGGHLECGANYMLTFIDDFSRKVWAFFLKQKSDVFFTFKSSKTTIEKKKGKQIKYLCTDNGLEFCSNEFNRLCKSEEIVRHLTVRHTPQQNGVAERMNRTIMEKVRCMLSNANLPKSFWAEAASTACFLINRSSSVSIDKRLHKRVVSSLQYSIVKNKARREIKPPKKYAEVDLVAYALNVAKDIDANQKTHLIILRRLAVKT
ncbi:hypothetical protein CXB51_007827 [Gossypium anomalum]|uniref:Integrase catalytic domain-containing protein n=1 Tax=Gossypium anomalum TaxID=47600 RepID=A0A8J6D6E4_9ROSI|nr:hypothetical protein CXB51_007827 [Gossypium anomalum]